VTYEKPCRGGQPRNLRLIRPPHADAIVSDPRPVLDDRGGLVNTPHASVDALAVCRQARQADDFLLAGRVGEAVSRAGAS